MSEAVKPKGPVFNLKNPCLAKLKHAHDLTGPAASKNTRHYEFSLEGSGMEYLPGDSLAVLPVNDPELVHAVLVQLELNGDEVVANPKGGEGTIRQILSEVLSLTEIDRKFFKALAEKTPLAEDLGHLTTPEKKAEFDQEIYGKDILDYLQKFHEAKFTPAEFVSVLRRLNVRLYSISSSLKANPDEVHLTVATVRYLSHDDRLRKGVASTFLAERLSPGQTVATFISPGKGFRLPEPEEETPIIMVGPGTGVAPFRAFIQERTVTGAKGKSWLFFGETHEATCFFYREEFEQALSNGSLTRLTTAFSRDQAHKVYVQHRILENGSELWKWLEEGAILYVCGDAKHMAHDVDLAFHEIIQREGGKSAEEATEYLEALKSAKRYRRDVY